MVILFWARGLSLAVSIMIAFLWVVANDRTKPIMGHNLIISLILTALIFLIDYTTENFEIKISKKN